MSAKQSNGGNKIDVKRLCLYSLLCAACLVLGYIESLIPTAVIAPGIKLGLSNAVALLLVCIGDTKGAFSVNIARIFLSALLFGSAISLAFALSGGIASLFIIAVLYRLNIFGVVGLSAIGGVVHNLVQAGVAFLLLGSGVIMYIPFLILGGVISGVAVGLICGIILKKVETKRLK